MAGKRRGYGRLEVRGGEVVTIVLPGATDGNGLRKRSKVMIDKTQTVPRDKIGSTIGRLHSDTLVEVDRALATFLGIG